MEGPTNYTEAELALLLTENDLWMKGSTGEDDSLCRAISSSLFFTERFHAEVQKGLVGFFLSHSQQINFKFLRQFSHRQLAEDFIAFPGRPEYESVNLELAAHFFGRRIKLYYPLGHRFCNETFLQKQPRVLRLFKSDSATHAAVFKAKTERAAVLCQQIVLRLVDRIFEPKTDVFAVDANASFTNFDLIYLKKESAELSKVSEPASASRQPQNPSEAAEDRQFWAREPGENTSVGEDLLQMIKSRKCKSLKQEEQTQQNFLKSFVDPLTFFDTLQLRCSDPPGTNDFGSEESFEEYVRKYQTENDKLNVDVDLDRLSLDANSKPVISTVSTQSDDLVVDRTLPQQLPMRELESKRPNLTLAGSGSFGNIDALDWTTPGSPMTQGGIKNSLKQKLKQRQKIPKEFVPSVPIPPSEVSLPSYRQSRPDLSELGGRYIPPYSYPTPAPLTPAGPKNQSYTTLKGLASYESSAKDRYIEMIDPILYEGRLKFFDEKNGFGFLLVKENGVVQDLFVYKSEFERAKVPMESLRQVKNGLPLYFSFQIARYTTRGQSSKKAINIRLVRRSE